MPLANRLLRLIPPQTGYTAVPGVADTSVPLDDAGAPLPDLRQDNSADMVQQNPLAQLGASADATGTTNTPILNKFNQLTPPNPADYPPTRRQRIMAGLAAMSGAGPSAYVGGAAVGSSYNPEAFKMSQAIRNESYNRAMNQFDTQAGLLEKGAGLEERKLTNERMMKRDAELDAYRQQIADIRQQQQDTAAQKAAADAKAKQDKLEADIKKAQDALAEKQREADMKQGNAESLMKLKEAQINLTELLGKLKLEQSAQALDEAKRKHDADIQAKQDEIEIQKKRAKIAEDALAEKSKPVETQTSTEPEHGALYNWWAGKGFTSTPKTTTTVKGPVGAGPKPGFTLMRGPDGNKYNIPNDKVEDAKKNKMVVVQQ